VPGGDLDQLYRYVPMRQQDGTWKKRLLPTPGVWPDGRVHALHMSPADVGGDRQEVWICEGCWDGMALWEVARSCKWGVGGLEYTGNPASSLLSTANIIAVPGCNVWRDEWSELCRGKHVLTMFDSDHPRTINGRTLRAGFDATYRLCKRLSGIAQSVRWIAWGADGFDPTLSDGCDVRDWLRMAN
jgi:hypothetical protein